MTLFQKKIISDLFIKNNINYITHPFYRDYIENDKSRRQFDWYLTDYNIAVEYFGMYDKNEINKNNRLGRYSKKVLKKISDCNKNNIKMIPIYPVDLNDNYLGLLEKFSINGINISLSN